jgi:membrane associated rhomboid family serine protease
MLSSHINKFKKINKVTKTITIVSVFFYLLGIFSLIVNPMIIDGLNLDISGVSYSTIYEIFTYPFVHDFHPSHLLFNLSLLILFGNILEKEIGVKNYILLIVFGWVFNFLPMMFLGKDGEIVGLSGIVISIIIFNVLVSKNTPSAVKFLGLVYCMDSLFNALKGDFFNNMTIFGHVLGIIGGLLFVLLYKTKKVTL